MEWIPFADFGVYAVWSTCWISLLSWCSYYGYRLLPSSIHVVLHCSRYLNIYNIWFIWLELLWFLQFNLCRVHLDLIDNLLISIVLSNLSLSRLQDHLFMLDICSALFLNQENASHFFSAWITTSRSMKAILKREK